ncbi:hypothetical protein F4820DRAFT_289229 [Hypoxylon rubiginosum]|uniref:Uncharacterized protein n=1 Tax=Hypoxylon rubiginosum TaxID=110542 RepID=A0ACB9ZF93_9PEZI|nr:hypothetical protein F4820DRAFT_289229 [Hypoxylon rubiginosum]
MSLLQKRYLSALPRPDLLLRANQKPLLVAAGLAVAATPLLAYAWTCYREWLTLGRGGPPYNVLGWLAQALMQPFARRDTRVPVPPPYRTAADVAAALYPSSGSAATRSYLAAWARGRRRSGDRPGVPTFVAPQRQATEKGGEEGVRRQKAFLAALARANPGLFEMRDSGLEGPLHQALFLRSFPSSSSSSTSTSSSSPSSTTASATKTDEEEAKKKKKEKEAKDLELRTRLGRGTRGEFAHVHGEGSTHVTVSAADAAALIGGGWAERHKLSGVGGRRAMIPFGYVLIYAPRRGEGEDGEDEFEFWKEVVVAGARYAAEGGGVEVVVPE